MRKLRYDEALKQVRDEAKIATQDSIDFTILYLNVHAISW
jgi:hypothetical protein